LTTWPSYVVDAKRDDDYELVILSKQFFRCQRQWYFKNHIASWQAKKDPIRRETYLLSKLDSIFAWRGKLVDKVITKHIVNPINYGEELDEQHVLQQAQGLFELQMAFAKAHRLREPGMTASKANDEFAAWRKIEYQEQVSDDLIANAWNDVEMAIHNLFAMEELIRKLRAADKLVPQRRLTFSFEGISPELISVRAVPDLLAFYQNKPPMIVDWKVHSFGRTDYRLQLACYALSLTCCKPHSDFPVGLSKYSPTDIALLETQLLTNHERPYILTQDDIYELETYIAETAMLMQLAVDATESVNFAPLEIPTTRYPETCASCQFPKICWEESIWKSNPPQEWKQMPLF
jgi:hypothetical protein